MGRYSFGGTGPRFILGHAEHVHDAAERAGPDRHRDRLAGVGHCEAALQSFARTHGDGAHDAVAELLLHFEREVDVFELQRVIDLGDLIARELHVDDGADDLDDFAGSHFPRLDSPATGLVTESVRSNARRRFSVQLRLKGGRQPVDPIGPPLGAQISFVIAAWRALL